MAKVKNFKRCPRCETKAGLTDPKCPNCGLIFARLNNVTNKAAKKFLRKKQKNKVIFDKVLPPDVHKWRLFFWCLFLGMFGAHRFKVGRVKSAVVYLISTLLLITVAFFPLDWWDDYWLTTMMNVMIIPAACVCISWIIDIINLLTGKFKVPVAIPEDNVVGEEAGYKQVLDKVEEINSTVGRHKKKQIKRQIREEFNEILAKSSESDGTAVQADDAQAESAETQAEPEKPAENAAVNKYKKKYNSFNNTKSGKKRGKR